MIYMCGVVLLASLAMYCIYNPIAVCILLHPVITGFVVISPIKCMIVLFLAFVVLNNWLPECSFGC